MLTWQECYVGQLPSDFLAGLQQSEWTAQWQRRAAQIEEWPWLDLLVLEDENQVVVGFAAVGSSRDDGAISTTGELQGIYLRASHWGQGQGRQLLNRGLARLRQLGHRDATLWVLDSNEGARGFYEASGWTTDGVVRQETVGDQPVTEVRYTIDLTGA
jgi:L-amino acid N-acyltransferase YncA